MQLLLEIVSPQAGAMGANRRRLVGAAGVRIGRDAGTNDWVINSEYVSRQHAIIRCLSGMYFVEAKSSALTAVNDRARPLAKDEAQPLRAGDTLFVDEYEIQVRPAGEEAAQNVPAAAAPGLLDDLLAPAAPPFRQGPGDLAGLSGAPADVLDLLGGAPPARASTISSPPAPAHDPSRLDDLFAQNYAPAPVQPAAPASKAGLEDDWFKTSMPKAPARPLKPQPASASRPVAPAAPAMPPAPPVMPAPPAPTPASAPMPASASAASGATINPPVAAHSSAPADAAGLAAQILAGTGLDPAQHALSPEVLRQFGAVMRTVVDGTMQVLQARSEIKDAFRLPETRIARSHNNPLKFSVDAADALQRLLVQRNDAYLDTQAAFEDAFEDIRFHQLAMLKGMQAGFDKMLEQFDPAEQQKRAERSTGGGGLAAFAGLGARKGRLWDEYAASYQALVEDRDDAFRRLFGDAFGRAYEEELRRLKTLARAGRRTTGERA